MLIVFLSIHMTKNLILRHIIYGNEVLHASATDTQLLFGMKRNKYYVQEVHHDFLPYLPIAYVNTGLRH